MTCAAVGCEREKIVGRGLCRKHYQGWWKRHGAEAKASRPKHGACVVPDCGRRVYRLRDSHCKKHLKRLLRHGTTDVKWTPDGEGHVTIHGYRRVTVPKTGRIVFAHRRVMESVLGRPLHRHEKVHHLNGDRLDNRPENLELWSVMQPPGQRVSDKLQWAYDLIAEYEPEWFGGGC